VLAPEGAEEADSESETEALPLALPLNCAELVELKVPGIEADPVPLPEAVAAALPLALPQELGVKVPTTELLWLTQAVAVKEGACPVPLSVEDTVVDTTCEREVVGVA